MSFRRSISLKEISNYQTGGDCAHFFAPHSPRELVEALTFIHGKSLPVFFLGGGTNSLVLDSFWDGAVISFKNLKKIEREGDFLHCEAGVVNTDLSLFALKNGLSGLEWMYSLPGQIGGTVRMNARCYGGEIGDLVEEVHAYTLEGEYKNYKKGKDTFRGYKDTVFMDESVVIASVGIRLRESSEMEAMKEKMDFCKADRESKGHFVFPSCGCVFKNNYDPEISVPSGLLLEHAQAKSLSVGAARVSDKHANFIYNTGGASSWDILDLAMLMREKVWDLFGVWLEFEMEILGDLSEDYRTKIEEKREHRYNKPLLEDMRRQFHRC